MTALLPEHRVSHAEMSLPDRTGLNAPLNRGLCWTLLAFAAALRIIRFAHDHGLWLDEAYLALNLIHRSFAQLTVELDYEQYAPIGFLFIMKSFVVALGRSDYVFRFFPFLASLASVYLYFVLSKRLLRSSAIPLAIGLFAISYPLLIYSAEAKPYGVDATVSLTVTLVGVMYGANPRPTPLQVAELALVGALAVWLSFPAAFVLAGIGISLGVGYLWRRDWASAGLLGVVAVVWLASFGLQASMIRGSTQPQLPNSDLRGLRDFYSQDFVPWPPYPGAVVKWMTHFFPNLTGVFTSEIAAGVGVFAFLMGCVALGTTRRRELALLTVPLIVALLVSAARLYPMGDRFMLFIGPSLLLVIAAGFDEVRARVGVQGRLVWILLLVVFLFQPSLRAVKQSVRLEHYGDARPAVARLDDRVRDGDMIYLYWTGVPLYRLYSKVPHPDENVLVGRRSERWAAHAKDLERLIGEPRVWVLFSFNAHHSPAGQTVRDELDRRGLLLDAYESDETALYLYDLAGNPEAGSP